MHSANPSIAREPVALQLGLAGAAGQGATAPWQLLQQQARQQAAHEPLLAAHLESLVLRHEAVEGALAHLLARKLATPALHEAALASLFGRCFAEAPHIAFAMQRDLAAVAERDPAARDRVDIFLNQKGFQALQAYRVAHHLWGTQRPALARFLQGRVAEVYAIDIHPAARIGDGVLIDHGTGVVIGETAVLGDDCTLFQDVTLGGTGKHGGDRHPKVGHGVLICAGAKVLGNVRIGDGAKVGAASVVLADVPAGVTVVGVPATVVVPRSRGWPAAADIA